MHNEYAYASLLCEGTCFFFFFSFFLPSTVAHMLSHSFSKIADQIRTCYICLYNMGAVEHAYREPSKFPSTIVKKFKQHMHRECLGLAKAAAALCLHYCWSPSLPPPATCRRPKGAEIHLSNKFSIGLSPYN